MCGSVAILSRNACRGARAARRHRGLRHRGPDGMRTWIDEDGRGAGPHDLPAPPPGGTLIGMLPADTAALVVTLVLMILWEGMRNYHVRYEVFRSPCENSPAPHRIDFESVFPKSLRHLLLQSYLFGSLWVQIDAARLATLKEALLIRYARRYARLHPDAGSIEIFAITQRITPDTSRSIAASVNSCFDSPAGAGRRWSATRPQLPERSLCAAS